MPYKQQASAFSKVSIGYSGEGLVPINRPARSGENRPAMPSPALKPRGRPCGFVLSLSSLLDYSDPCW
ncbi:hypothetical protein SKAU_G00165270 [Synaphobranchus kaupii]|uniref:Uncharacterized protein n=1 Tax=Synaphobranchus kaupii TaxID=118154 RepID=A0A9Q1J0A2_SYNKA|nr:hypothetical protein SKAU_G00165270 [Synaphobranchus kaupii]